MAINLKISTKDVKSSLKDAMKVQYIPAKIEGDGPANLEKYFTPYTDVQPDGSLKNALRGYPLHGEHKNLPEGYTGVIFQETKKPLSSEEDRTFAFGGSFREFTYWNYDRNPSKNDAFEKALNWLQLAEVLHDDGQDEEEGKAKSKVAKKDKSGKDD